MGMETSVLGSVLFGWQLVSDWRNLPDEDLPSTRSEDWHPVGPEPICRHL